MEDHKNAKEAKVKLHEYKKKIGEWTSFLCLPFALFYRASKNVRHMKDYWSLILQVMMLKDVFFHSRYTKFGIEI